jgi:hypothetical protein
VPCFQCPIAYFRSRRQASIIYFANTASASSTQFFAVGLMYLGLMNLNENRGGIAANAATAGVLPARLGAITPDISFSPVIAFFER